MTTDSSVVTTVTYDKVVSARIAYFHMAEKFDDEFEDA